MKFKVNAEAFQNAISPVCLVAEKGVVKDYPSSFKITLTVSGDKMTAVADGGAITAQTLIDASWLGVIFERDGEVTVNSTDFQQTINSFHNSDELIFELSQPSDPSHGKELIIRKADSPDEFQSVPVFNELCSFAELSVSNKDPKIQIKRNVFASYANKIVFAHGFQMSMKSLTYWVLRATKNGTLRFVAGDGQRFAVADIEGKDILSVSEDVNILFPNEQTPALISVLNKVNCENIEISSNKKSLAVKCGNTIINFYNCDPSITWYDENRFLNRESQFKCVTKIGSWKGAVKGLLATNNEEAKKQNHPHFCHLSFDASNKLINSKSDSSMKSSRKISIEDCTGQSNESLAIKCASLYINEAFSKGTEEDRVQIEIDDPTKPIVIRYYAGDKVSDPSLMTKNNNSVTEKFAVFFATNK